MGNGTYDNTDAEFYYGKIDKKLFKKTVDKISDDFLNFSGKYLLSQAGIPCRILIKVYNDTETVIYDFIYGSKFSGLADEIRNFIAALIEVTNDWYTAEQAKPKAMEIPKEDENHL